MSIPVDHPWIDDVYPTGGGGFRSSDEDTNYGEAALVDAGKLRHGGAGERRSALLDTGVLRHGEKITADDTRNTRDIALEAKETTKKIKDDLAFIKERLHELVNETSDHEQQRAELEKKLAGSGEYNPTIPNQDLFAIDVDKLIHDLGQVFQIEKEMMEGDRGDRDHINIVAAHVGHTLWEHLRLPTELYDAWIDATDCASGLDKK